MNVSNVDIQINEHYSLITSKPKAKRIITGLAEVFADTIPKDQSQQSKSYKSYVLIVTM